VSKRNARRAVDRNRLKRLIRESFRTSKVRPLTLDIVILAKAHATTANAAGLRKSLERWWTSLSSFADRQHRQTQR
jgi:ribonuclease P protein component